MKLNKLIVKQAMRELLEGLLIFLVLSIKVSLIH